MRWAALQAGAHLVPLIGPQREMGHDRDGGKCLQAASAQDGHREWEIVLCCVIALTTEWIHSGLGLS